MQLYITTDYAIRMVLCVARQRELVSSAEISAATAIPENSVKSIGRTLCIAGILTARRGNSGGFALNRHPAEIFLGDIIHVMENIRINRCLDPDHFCSNGASGSCPVRAYYTQVQDQLENLFASKTIASLLQDTEKAANKGGECG